MFAEASSRWLGRRGIHYSWVVVIIIFMAMLISSSALGLPGAFLRPLSREFGWTTGQISSALAVRFALFGLTGPFAAVLLERYGLRRIVCIALALIAAGLLLATQMAALWQLFVLWGVLLGAGSGMIALVLGATVANRWFDRRRGLVIGILTASSAAGQLVFLPLAATLIEQFGWRVAVAPTVAGCLCVAVLAACFLRERPSDLGLVPYGAEPESIDADRGIGVGRPGVRKAAESSSVPPTPLNAAARLPSQKVAKARGVTTRPSFLVPIRVLWQAAHHGTFWVLFGTFFICGLSTSGLIQTHFISLCGDYGLAALPAASVLAMMGAFDFVGTIGSGWLSDRFDNRKLLSWYYGLRGLSLLWLPQSDFTLYGLALFALFYGLDWVATVPPTVKLASAAIDRQRGAMIFGWIFAGHQLGSATAAYGAGLTRTLLLTYSPAVYTAGALCLLAALAIFLVPNPRRMRQAGGSAHGSFAPGVAFSGD